MRRAFVGSILALATTLACNGQNEKPSKQENTDTQADGKVRRDIVYDRSALMEIMDQRQLHPQNVIKAVEVDQNIAEHYAKTLGGSAAEVELMLFTPRDSKPVPGGGDLALAKMARVPQQRSQSVGELTETDDDYEPSDTERLVAGRIGALLQGHELRRTISGNVFNINIRASVEHLRGIVLEDLLRRLPPRLDPKARAAAVADATAAAQLAVTPSDLLTFFKVSGTSRRGILQTEEELAIQAEDDAANAAAAVEPIRRLSRGQRQRARRAANRRPQYETWAAYVERIENAPMRQRIVPLVGGLGLGIATGAALGGGIWAAKHGLRYFIPGAYEGVICGVAEYCIFLGRHRILSLLQSAGLEWLVPPIFIEEE